MKKTILPDPLTDIEVYFDASCGFCRRFRKWLLAQDLRVEVEFIDYRSERALLLFPELDRWSPDKELVVRTVRGEVFQGAEAWAVCLDACRSRRRWARYLASPGLLPLAKPLAGMFAANRLKLSAFFFGSEGASKTGGSGENEELVMMHRPVDPDVGHGGKKQVLGGPARRPDIPDGLI